MSIPCKGNVPQGNGSQCHQGIPVEEHGLPKKICLKLKVERFS